MHKVVDHAECYVRVQVQTNGLENFWSLLKRTIKGTYVNVDDQAFRFNERKRTNFERFEKAIQTVAGMGFTYNVLTGTRSSN